jgi:hypothetical protein
MPRTIAIEIIFWVKQTAIDVLGATDGAGIEAKDFVKLYTHCTAVPKTPKTLTPQRMNYEARFGSISGKPKASPAW